MSLDLPYYNSTSYPAAVKSQLESIEYTEEDKAKLHLHQFIPKEFFTRNPHARGLLIMLAMGMGKTRLAVAIADYFNKKQPNRKIYVLLPKSLEGNFIKTVCDYTNTPEDKARQRYKFVSLNASNMADQVSRINLSKDEADYERRLGNFMDDMIKQNSLDNSMLIVDEAHNLFNAITNNSKNGVRLYDMINKARNIKLIFLTGTPVINDPFELVPCFNMLRGPIRIDHAPTINSKVIETSEETLEDTTLAESVTGGFTKSKKPIEAFTQLFSESYDEFRDYFVDYENGKVKNKDKFTNRIYGLVSYYGDLYFSKSQAREGFPTQLPRIVVKVPMSQTQFLVYASARTTEKEENSKGYRDKKARFSASAGGSSTYRVKSRQISNYAIPEYALGPIRGQKSREKFISKIREEDLLNVKKYSPKMEKVLENIEAHKNQLGMVYSQFVSGEGIAIFARILRAKKWKEVDEPNDDIDEFTKKKSKVYAILSGSIDPKERIELINRFNADSNKHGEEINLLLVSGAVAEGVDLKRIRHVHCLEPFWNMARINQVETRAIRYNSHIDLPLDEQNVQTYLYLSDYPTNVEKKIKEEEHTTDVELYEKSVSNMKLIDDFMLALAESSIDCSLHYKNLSDEVKAKIKCKMCSPTDIILYDPILEKDMLAPSSCAPYTEKKIDVKKINIPETNEDYYYKEDGDKIVLYMYSWKLKGYTKMPRTHPYYGRIMEKYISEKYKR
jgi:superfamily II DNA or RNA helicase